VVAAHSVSGSWPHVHALHGCGIDWSCSWSALQLSGDCATGGANNASGPVSCPWHLQLDLEYVRAVQDAGTAVSGAISAIQFGQPGRDGTCHRGTGKAGLRSILCPLQARMLGRQPFQMALHHPVIQTTVVDTMLDRNPTHRRA
jgi:hypothetical protein